MKTKEINIRTAYLSKQEIEIMDNINSRMQAIYESMITVLHPEIREYFVLKRSKVIEEKIRFVRYLTQLYAPEEYTKLINPKPLQYHEQLSKITFICEEKES